MDGARAEPGQALYDDTCPHCYLSPCVTRHKQSWLGAGAAPHGRNSSNRKKKYRLFWNMLSNVGAWNHPQYIAKTEALHIDRNDTTVWTVRDNAILRIEFSAFIIPKSSKPTLYGTQMVLTISSYLKMMVRCVNDSAGNYISLCMSAYFSLL